MLSVLAGVLCVAGLVTPAAAQVAFDRFDVHLSSAARQTVLTGFLLGGPIADVAVVRIDENGDRRLRIFALDEAGGAFSPAVDAILRPGVSFVDVATIGGRDRIVTYRPGGLSWFDPESTAERELVAVRSSFTRPRDGEIPHVDVTQDVNDDDRDDLVVPGVDGFSVFIQMRDGTFADPAQVGPVTDLAGIMGADGYRYDPWAQSRIYQMDYDQNGRRDLVFWELDHFEVHFQNQRGLFAPASETFTTDVRFDSDNLFSLATGDMTGRVLHSLADMNGDGVGDLVVASLDGPRISSKRSAYHIHFGSLTLDGGTGFAPGPDIEIRTDDRVQLAMDRHDFDGDGRLDLMVTTIDIAYLEGSLWKRLKGFMGDDIWLDLEFYRLEEGGYTAEPSATLRVQLDGPPSPREPGWVPLDIVLRGGTHENRRTREGYGRSFNTIFHAGDVTGDGRSDLLIGWPADTLHVLVGTTGPELFAPRQVIEVAIPDDHEYTWLADLNRDGRQDVVMHYPSATGAHQVTLMIAR